jgi:hypothetical protein
LEKARAENLLTLSLDKRVTNFDFFIKKLLPGQLKPYSKMPRGSAVYQWNKEVV